MNKFEIEIKSDLKDLPKYEFAYTVKSDGFEADVTVFHCKKANPFVHQHLCKKGGDLLWKFGFWFELQNQVIHYHLNKMEEKKNESRV